MKVLLRAVATVALCTDAPVSAAAADLHPNTAAAFDRYVQTTEARIRSEVGRRFLWLDRLPDAQRNEVNEELRRGEVVVRRLETHEAGAPIKIPDGMCHHWIGTVFVPGAALGDAVGLMQDYDKYERVYRPAVRRSRLLSQNGGHFTAYLQLFMKKVI